MFDGRSETGRRDRKKRETREKILSAASALFERNGFDRTTMEEVAAKADVGVGTLYNYFRSKDRLLLGVFESATERLLAQGRAILKEPGDDAERAVVRLLTAYLPLATLFGKPVLREMVAAAMSRPTEEVEEFTRLDAALAASIGELLVELRSRGTIAHDIDVESAALAIYGALGLPTLMFIGMTEMDEAALSTMVRRQVHTMFAGLLPREPPTRGPAKRTKWRKK